VFPALLTTLLFSISVVCGHRSAKLIGGTEANFWRLSCATLFLSVWAYSFGIGLGGQAFPIFLWSGIVGIGVGDVALFQALPRLGSRLSLLLIQCLTAPFGALIEWTWLGTTLSLWQMGCGLTIVIGVAIALKPGARLANGPELAGSSAPGKLKALDSSRVIGAIACLVAALGGAYGAVLSRKAYVVAHAAQQPIDGANAAFQRIIGGLFVAGVCLLIVKRRELRIEARAPQHLLVDASKRKWRAVWPWVLINSVAGQTFGVSCMQWALETTPTGVVLAIIAMTPIVVIPFALIVEGERPTFHSLVGGAFAVLGVIGLTLSR
jgi:drug/metabolite transporter (DMT)-like permease